MSQVDRIEIGVSGSDIVVIETGVSGTPGTGVTAAEKAGMLDAIERMDRRTIDVIERMDRRTIDVRAHGAKGDGVTDDTAAIQAALTDATVAGNPAAVLLGAGTYRVSATLVVPGNVTLRGVGTRATIIRASDTFPASPVVRLGRTDQNVQHGAVLEDLSVHGNMRPGTIGVYTDNAHEPSALRRVVVSGAMSRQVYVTSGDTPGHYSNHMLFDDCEFFSPGSAATGATVDIRKSGNPVELRRCTINTASGSGKGSVAVRVDDAPVVLTSCHFELHDVGADVYIGTGSKGHLTVNTLTGHANMGHMVRFNDLATGVLININPMGASSAVYDTTANAGAGAVVLPTWAPFYVHKGADRRVVREITSALDWSTWNASHPEDVILANCSSGLIAMSTPPAHYNRGREIIFKKTDSSSNPLEVRRNGQTPTGIDGVTGKRITSRNGYIHIMSDGEKWFTLGYGGTVEDIP